MPMTLQNMLLYARQLYADTDTTNAAFSDVQLTRHINEHYIRMRDMFSPRMEHLTATNLGINGVGAGTKSYPINNATVSVAEIKQAFAESGASRDTVTIGTPMTREDIGTVLQLQESQTTQGKPRIFAVQRVGTFTAASVGNIRIWAWPINDGTYALSALVRREVTELAVNADVPDVTDGEAYTICRLAAADAALIAGRPVEMVRAILAPVPEKMKSHLKIAIRAIKPMTVQPGEVAAGA